MTTEVLHSDTDHHGSDDHISTHPLIGVIAVLLGVINSALAARLTSFALPDLRGALGIGIDEGAWLPTAINAP